MPTVAIKTKGGGIAGELSLSERVFGAPLNLPLMHQAVRAELMNSRQGTKNTKGRSDMLAGGRKPYKQKGTGRARQGSTVAPHYRHGAKALAFHPRDIERSIPKKMRRLAIRTALSAKLADGELIVVDRIPLDGEISTKTAAQFITEVTAGASKTLVILEAHDEVMIRSLRNIASVTLRIAPQFSTLDVVDGGIVILTRAAAERIESQWGEEVEAAEPLAGEEDVAATGEDA